MRLRELFQDPLTLKLHEVSDIHYIGEALPAPSLAVSVLSTGTPAFVGGSPVPAREDHVHALDLSDLIQALSELEDPPVIEVDLENYYDKTEVDNLLDAINNSISNVEDSLDILSSTVDSLLLTLANDYYTAAQVDALLDGAGGGGPGDHVWAYSDSVVDPDSTVFSDRWYPPGNITITSLAVAVNVAAGSGHDYIIVLWKDGISVGSVVLNATNNTASTSLSVSGSSLNRFQVSVAKDGSFVGDAEEMTVMIRYDHA